MRSSARRLRRCQTVALTAAAVARIAPISTSRRDLREAVEPLARVASRARPSAASAVSTDERARPPVRAPRAHAAAPLLRARRPARDRARARSGRLSAPGARVVALVEDHRPRRPADVRQLRRQPQRRPSGRRRQREAVADLQVQLVGDRLRDGRPAAGAHAPGGERLVAVDDLAGRDRDAVAGRPADRPQAPARRRRGRRPGRCGRWRPSSSCASRPARRGASKSIGRERVLGPAWRDPQVGRWVRP